MIVELFELASNMTETMKRTEADEMTVSFFNHNGYKISVTVTDKNAIKEESEK